MPRKKAAKVAPVPREAPVLRDRPFRVNRNRASARGIAIIRIQEERG